MNAGEMPTWLKAVLWVAKAYFYAVICIAIVVIVVLEFAGALASLIVP